MRKNKISDVIFGLLLLGCILSSLTGCGTKTASVPARDYDYTVEIQTESIEASEPEIAIQDETVKANNDVAPVQTVDAYTAETETVDMSDIESIKSVCGLKAPVETDVAACHWNSFGEHPYDVVYDFGEEYQKYVDACDWSLVFDADYYMDEFPMLALQYHYDEKELLFHFQTVGIHEGRQGSKDFNICAYAMNGKPEVENAFGSDYEGYYLYYMLNYDTEKNINTVTTDKMNITNMCTYRPTALQISEMKAVCKTRNSVDVEDVSMASELCAFANYRAYLNAHDGYKAHDWAKENLDLFKTYCSQMGGTSAAAENTVTNHCNDMLGEINEIDYRHSKPHYEAMVNAKYHYIGVSNTCNGDDSSSQFDFFIDSIN